MAALPIQAMLSAIAEGVETAEQHQQLASIGCDFCQASLVFVPAAMTEAESDSKWTAVDALASGKWGLTGSRITGLSPRRAYVHLRSDQGSTK